MKINCVGGSVNFHFVLFLMLYFMVDGESFPFLVFKASKVEIGPGPQLTFLTLLSYSSLSWN